MFLLWPTILLVFYGLPYYFSTVLRAASASVYHHANVYTAYCAAQVHLHLSFFKLKDTRSAAGHETCSSSWSSDRNLFYFFITITLIINFNGVREKGRTRKLQIFSVVGN